MGRLGFSVAEVGRGSRESRMRKMAILWMVCPFCEPIRMDDTIASEGHRCTLWSSYDAKDKVADIPVCRII